MKVGSEDLAHLSQVGTSAIFPSPNRVCKNADNRDCHLRTPIRPNYPYTRAQAEVRQGVGAGQPQVWELAGVRVAGPGSRAGWVTAHFLRAQAARWRQQCRTSRPIAYRRCRLVSGRTGGPRVLGLTEYCRCCIHSRVPAVPPEPVSSGPRTPEERATRLPFPRVFSISGPIATGCSAHEITELQPAFLAADAFTGRIHIVV